MPCIIKSLNRVEETDNCPSGDGSSVYDFTIGHIEIFELVRSTLEGDGYFMSVDDAVRCRNDISDLVQKVIIGTIASLSTNYVNIYLPLGQMSGFTLFRFDLNEDIALKLMGIETIYDRFYQELSPHVANLIHRYTIECRTACLDKEVEEYFKRANKTVDADDEIS